MSPKIVSYITVSIFLVLNCAIAHGCGQKDKGAKEQVDIVTISVSPNRDYLATVYIVWGGGAAGYVYRVVNVRKHGERFDPKKGIVLHMSSKSNPTVAWDGNEHLVIQHSKAATIYKQERQWGDKVKVKVDYLQN
jgi:hypothetical protein